MARSTGRSESDIAREAIADYCAKETAQPTVYDLMKKSGLIGCARGMPSDLATNPKYMEGFGRE
jgi:hypothetical protein